MASVLLIASILLVVVAIGCMCWHKIKPIENNENECLFLRTDPEQLTEGMFGQGFIWILEAMSSLANRDVCFDINTNEYGNIVPLIWVPRSQCVEKKKRRTINLVKYKKEHPECAFDASPYSFERAHEIWRQWFCLSGAIKVRVPRIPPNTLGVHYRGTDKNRDAAQANAMTLDEFMIVLQDFMDYGTPVKFSHIFACSDEQGLHERVSSRWPKIQVIQFPQTRASQRDATWKCRPVDFRSDHASEKQERAVAAVIDMYALSKCSHVLKSSSALSAFAKILNPEICMLQVSAMKIRWFPAGAILGYGGNTEVAKGILLRTLAGHVQPVVHNESEM